MIFARSRERPAAMRGEELGAIEDICWRRRSGQHNKRASQKSEVECAVPGTFCGLNFAFDTHSHFSTLTHFCFLPPVILDCTIGRFPAAFDVAGVAASLPPPPSATFCASYAFAILPIFSLLTTAWSTIGFG